MVIRNLYTVLLLCISLVAAIPASGSNPFKNTPYGQARLTSPPTHIYFNVGAKDSRQTMEKECHDFFSKAANISTTTCPHASKVKTRTFSCQVHRALFSHACFSDMELSCELLVASHSPAANPPNPIHQLNRDSHILLCYRRCTRDQTPIGVSLAHGVKDGKIFMLNSEPVSCQGKGSNRYCQVNLE
jgi:hypothetical protein